MTAPPKFREVPGDDRYRGQTTTPLGDKIAWVSGTGPEAREALLRLLDEARE